MSNTVQQLNPTSLQSAEYARSHYVITVDSAIPDKEIRNPSFWSHIAAKLKQFDTVEFRSEDGSFWAQYLVVAAERVWARVIPIHYIEIEKAVGTVEVSADVLNDYDIQWNKQNKWTVVRKSDRALMVSKLHSRTDAQEWLMKHVGAQKAA